MSESDGTIRIRIVAEHELGAALGGATAAAGGSLPLGGGKESPASGGRGKTSYMYAEQIAQIRKQMKEQGKAQASSFGAFLDPLKRGLGMVLGKELVAAMGTVPALAAILVIADILKGGFEMVLRVFGVLTKLLSLMVMPFANLLIPILLPLIRIMTPVVRFLFALLRPMMTTMMKAGAQGADPISVLGAGFMSIFGIDLTTEKDTLIRGLTEFFAGIVAIIVLVSASSAVTGAVSGLSGAIAMMLGSAGVAGAIATIATSAPVIAAVALVGITLAKMLSDFNDKLQKQYDTQMKKMGYPIVTPATNMDITATYGADYYKKLQESTKDQLASVVSVAEVSKGLTKDISGVASNVSLIKQSTNDWISQSIFGSSNQSILSQLGLPKKRFGGYVEDTGAYILHAGETVVPRSGGNSGSSNTYNITIPISNPQLGNNMDVKELVRQVSREMQIELSRRNSYSKGM